MPEQLECHGSHVEAARRQAAEERLAGCARRLGIAARDVRVRVVDDPGGRSVVVSLRVHGVEIVRSSRKGASLEENLEVLAGHLTDLVRNLERRIETLEQALHGDGLQVLPGGASPHAGLRPNLYRGDMSLEQVQEKARRALRRVGRSWEDLRMTWDEAEGWARLRLRLPDGRHAEKTSTQQADWQRNLAALVLWLETRARAVERGVLADLPSALSAYLLPYGGAR